MLGRKLAIVEAAVTSVSFTRKEDVAPSSSCERGKRGHVTQVQHV